MLFSILIQANKFKVGREVVNKMKELMKQAVL